MFKYLKKISVFVVVVVVMLLGTISVKAYSTKYFSLTATKLMDGETAHITHKENMTKAYVKLNSMSITGKSYEMWVERGASGRNVTDAYTFTTLTSRKLNYNKPVDADEEYDAKLNIGTSITTFKSCNFEGSWTPNVAANE